MTSLSPSDAERRGEGRDHIRKKIRRHAHVGVADENQFVFRRALELEERGHFAVRSEGFTADDELGVAPRIFFNDLTHHFTNRVIGIGDAKQDLHRAGIILIEPALQRSGGRFVAAFEGFEQGDGRRKGRVGDAPVQGKAPGRQPLPEDERQAQEGERGENCVGEIHQGSRTTGLKPWPGCPPVWLRCVRPGPARRAAGCHSCRRTYCR